MNIENKLPLTIDKITGNSTTQFPSSSFKELRVMLAFFGATTFLAGACGFLSDSPKPTPIPIAAGKDRNMDKRGPAAQTEPTQVIKKREAVARKVAVANTAPDISRDEVKNRGIDPLDRQHYVNNDSCGEDGDPATAEELLGCIRGNDLLPQYLAEQGMPLDLSVIKGKRPLSELPRFIASLDAAGISEEQAREDLGLNAGQMQMFIRDGNTLRTITAILLNDKQEVDRRRGAGEKDVFWTGENWWVLQKGTKVIPLRDICINPPGTILEGEKEEVIPTPTATVAPTPTSTPVPPEEEAPTPTPTPIPTLEPTATPQPTPEATAIPTPTLPPTPTTTPIPTREPTATAQPTPIPTREATATPQPTPAPTVEAVPTPTPTLPPTPTTTPIPTREATATPQPTPHATATSTPEPTATLLPTREATATPQPTPAPTVEAVPTPTPTPEVSATPASAPQAVQPTASATSAASPTREPIATPARR